MTIKEQIEKDIKQAMLSGDKTLTTTLRTLKSTALNIEVADGIRDVGLSDSKYIELLAKEAKRRQESADMYIKGGSSERAQSELAEKTIIEAYLPKQLSDGELSDLIKEVIQEMPADDNQLMGRVISEVKKRSAGKANGGRIASTVKAMITK